MRRLSYVIVLMFVAIAPLSVVAQGEASPPTAAGVADVDSLLASVMVLPDADAATRWTPISTRATVLMTPVFPGWGQMYTRNSWRSAVTFGAITWYWSQMVRNDRQAERRQAFSRTLEPGLNRDHYDALSLENRELMRDFAWWSGGALMIACLDAYVGALLYRFDEDPVAVPNNWRILEPAPVPDAIVGGSEPGVVLFEWRRSF